MFDVIDFLEKVGQDAQLRHAPQDEVGLALSDAEVDPELRVAILARDGRELQVLLGQTPYCCLINPAEPDEDQEGREGDEEKGDDTDEEKDMRSHGD